MVGFKSDMVQWVAKVADRIEKIPAEAAKNLVYDVRVPVKEGGNMPVLSGNLRNSIEVSFTGSRPADKELDPNFPLRDPMGTINPKLLRAKPGVLISIFFRAIYGPAMELKYAFVRLAAQKWRQHVKEAVETIKGRTP